VNSPSSSDTQFTLDYLRRSFRLESGPLATYMQATAIVHFTVIMVFHMKNDAADCSGASAEPSLVVRLTKLCGCANSQCSFQLLQLVGPIAAAHPSQGCSSSRFSVFTAFLFTVLHISRFFSSLLGTQLNANAKGNCHIPLAICIAVVSSSR